MRYLDTRVLQRIAAPRSRAARRRRYIWLVWMRPHFPTGEHRRAVRINVCWPVYLQHGDAA